MHMERRVQFAVVLATAGALFAQEPPGKATQSEPTRLGSTGLEMVLPAGMQVRDGAPLGLAFAAVADEVDGFSDSINLTVGPTSPPQVTDAGIKAEMTGMLGKMLT